MFVVIVKSGEEVIETIRNAMAEARDQGRGDRVTGRRRRLLRAEQHAG